MKFIIRISLTFLLILFLAPNILAQDFKYGFIVGMGMGNIYFNKYSAHMGFSPSYSYNINGYLECNINKYFSLSCESGLIHNGFAIKYINSKQFYTYTQLSLLANIALSKNLSISVGPELDYLIKAIGKTENDVWDISRTTKKVRFAGLLGLNYELYNNCDIALRFSHGLTPTYNFNISWPGSTIEIDNHYSYVQMILKYQINKS